MGFLITYQYVGAPPPKVVRIATGANNGAYYTFAHEYARLLASDGISLEVVPTAGSVENLELLKSGEVSLALVQGGSATKDDKERLQSLGSLFLEPVWIFVRKQSAVKRFLELKGNRVSIGDRRKRHSSSVNPVTIRCRDHGNQHATDSGGDHAGDRFVVERERSMPPFLSLRLRRRSFVNSLQSPLLNFSILIAPPAYGRRVSLSDPGDSQ